jgi:hypothetical protein
MKRGVIAGLLLSGVVLGGCSGFNNSRGIGDAPVGQQDRSAPEVVVFSDQFQNVETKCSHGNRLYTTTRNAAPVVVAHDPTCPQA